MQEAYAVVHNITSLFLYIYVFLSGMSAVRRCVQICNEKPVKRTLLDNFLRDTITNQKFHYVLVYNSF